MLELPVHLKLEDSILVCVSGVGGEYLPLCASTQAYTSGRLLNFRPPPILPFLSKIKPIWTKLTFDSICWIFTGGVDQQKVVFVPVSNRINLAILAFYPAFSIDNQQFFLHPFATNFGDPCWLNEILQTFGASEIPNPVSIILCSQCPVPTLEVKLDKYICRYISCTLFHRQRQVQRGPAEGGGAAAADPKAGRDQRFSGGWCRVWATQVHLCVCVWARACACAYIMPL